MKHSLPFFPALLLSLVLASISPPGHAADSGRVDLAPLASSIGASPKVNINFGPAMMAGFAETLRQSNSDVAGVLAGVSGLRLMVFEDVDTRLAESQVLDIIDQLGLSGWTPAITVEDDETRINILLLESGEFVSGLVLLLRDGDDTAIFANIHGALDPVMIGKLIGSGQAMSDLNLEDLLGQFQN
jgi:hypothetical protein